MINRSPETSPRTYVRIGGHVLQTHDSQKQNTLKAIVQDTYGSPDILELRDIDKPEIGDEEALVRVHAAGVDRGVWHLMTGLPYLTRLAFGLRAPRNPVPGMDLAGVVEAVGRSVSRFEPGDEVFGIGKGTFAEYARAREEKLVHKPASLTFEQAAVLAISGLTALQGLRDHGRVVPGQKVLIIGASGGVGTYAVQIAKAFGARNRSVRHREGGDGPVHRCGSRHRLHARGLRRGR
jgi:NADPH:quinone reductase-like Zn-dependent oxidoreductase